jgi:hypothetical protein
MSTPEPQPEMQPEMTAVSDHVATILLVEDNHGGVELTQQHALKRHLLLSGGCCRRAGA